MAAKSLIEWTDATWSPLRARVRADAPEIARQKGYTSLVQIAEKMVGRVGPHCEKVSPGCEKCYSETGNARCLPHNGTGLPFDRRSRDLVEPFLDENILTQPLHWRRPRRVFVESQSDLFGDWYRLEFIARCFGLMAAANWHTFQVLTKRIHRIAEMMNDPTGHFREFVEHEARDLLGPWLRPGWRFLWPLPNVWLGVSCESDAYNARIEDLIRTPAAVRFISAEPLLGPLNVRGYLMKGVDPGQCLNCGLGHGFDRCPNYGSVAKTRSHYGRSSDSPHCTEFRRKNFAIDWVIAGGESGGGARPMHPDWPRGLRDQCNAAGVPFFFKQWGEWAPCGFTNALGSSSNFHRFVGGQHMERVGKHAAGRLLDGVEHNALPAYWPANVGLVNGTPKAEELAVLA